MPVHSALGPRHPPPHDACCPLHSPQLNADNATKPWRGIGRSRPSASRTNLFFKTSSFAPWVGAMRALLPLTLHVRVG